jgi:hypothetical protein
MATARCEAHSQCTIRALTAAIRKELFTSGCESTFLSIADANFMVSFREKRLTLEDPLPTAGSPARGIGFDPMRNSEH